VTKQQTAALERFRAWDAGPKEGAYDPTPDAFLLARLLVEMTSVRPLDSAPSLASVTVHNPNPRSG